MALIAEKKAHCSRKGLKKRWIVQNVSLEKEQCGRNCARFEAEFQIVSVRLGNASGLVRPNDPCHPLAAGAGFRLFLHSSSQPCGPKWLTARKMARRPLAGDADRGAVKNGRGTKKREFAAIQFAAI